MPTEEVPTVPLITKEPNENSSEEENNESENDSGMQGSYTERDLDHRYENLQELVEEFINSKMELSSNVDVITQAFRFVKLDSHLAALSHQVISFCLILY